MVREYQKEFKRLANHVEGWPQKALIGTFLGGLRVEIAKPVKMFKPRSLWDTIHFARMQKDQLNHAKPFFRSDQSRYTPKHNFSEGNFNLIQSQT
jgi:hypothetical protein